MTPSWYAVYTAPRAEKKVSEKLKAAGIEHYLPLKTTIRQWSDRKKKVTIPVIYGYIFVRITPLQFKDVLHTFGIAAFVYEAKQPAKIKDEEIERLKLMVENHGDDLEFVLENIQAGDKVIVRKGNLQGLIGELIDRKGKHQVAIRIQHIGCALITIPISLVEKIKNDEA